MDNNQPFNPKPFNPRRRDIIKMAVFSVPIISAPFVITPSRSASKRIVVRDLGGVYNQIHKNILYEPFKQATGIEVVDVPAESDPIGQIRGMVNAKRYLWDMVSLNQRAIAILTSGDILLEQHELEQEPVIQSIPPQFVSSYGVGENVYTMVCAYRTDAFKGRRAPESWKDLWDVNHFPGRRSLRKHPFDTIEVALMADGVPPHSVYPCDLDRAFRSLDKIKSHIAVWWTSGPQAEQMLKSGEIDLMAAVISRVQAAIDAGAPIAFSWDQHLYGCQSWAILKGTPNADACRQFIRFAVDPKRQALLAPYAIGPTQPDAFKYIDPKQVKRLPSYPDNLKKGLFIDAAYWAKHQEAATERFNHWLVD